MWRCQRGGLSFLNSFASKNIRYRFVGLFHYCWFWFVWKNEKKRTECGRNFLVSPHWRQNFNLFSILISGFVSFYKVFFFFIKKIIYSCKYVGDRFSNANRSWRWLNIYPRFWEKSMKHTRMVEFLDMSRLWLIFSSENSQF